MKVSSLRAEARSLRAKATSLRAEATSLRTEATSPMAEAISLKAKAARARAGSKVHLWEVMTMGWGSWCFGGVKPLGIHQLFGTLF